MGLETADDAGLDETVSSETSLDETTELAASYGDADGRHLIGEVVLFLAFDIVGCLGHVGELIAYESDASSQFAVKQDFTVAVNPVEAEQRCSGDVTVCQLADLGRDLLVERPYAVFLCLLVGESDAEAHHTVLAVCYLGGYGANGLAVLGLDISLRDIGHLDIAEGVDDFNAREVAVADLPIILLEVFPPRSLFPLGSGGGVRDRSKEKEREQEGDEERRGGWFHCAVIERKRCVSVPFAKVRN